MRVVVVSRVAVEPSLGRDGNVGRLFQAARSREVQDSSPGRDQGSRELRDLRVESERRVTRRKSVAGFMFTQRRQRPTTPTRPGPTESKTMIGGVDDTNGANKNDACDRTQIEPLLHEAETVLNSARKRAKR